jgi:tetratricopeptide (TPR) repeat protein
VASITPPGNVTLQIQKIQPPALSKQISAEPLTTTQKEPSSSPSEDNSTTQINPRGADAYLKRGRTYLNTGDYARAIADFNQVLQLNPNSAAAYFSRGRANKLSGNYEPALADYNEAIQLNPKMFPAYVNRGQLYNMADRYDAAIADFDQALELDPNLPIPYLNRGVAYGAKGDYDGAIADFNSALTLAPDFSPAYNNLAWLMATCPQSAFRDGKKAVEYATKACELSDWNNINQIDTLAAACAEAGDFANAMKWEGKVLETPDLAPEDAAIAKNRLALYETRQPYHREQSIQSSEGH